MSGGGSYRIQTSGKIAQWRPPRRFRLRGSGHGEDGVSPELLPKHGRALGCPSSSASSAAVVSLAGSTKYSSSSALSPRTTSGSATSLESLLSFLFERSRGSTLGNLCLRAAVYTILQRGKVSRRERRRINVLSSVFGRFCPARHEKRGTSFYGRAPSGLVLITPAIHHYRLASGIVRGHRSY